MYWLGVVWQVEGTHVTTPFRTVVVDISEDRAWKQVNFMGRGIPGPKVVKVRRMPTWYHRTQFRMM